MASAGTEPPPTTPLPVFTLLCKSDLARSLVCLPSLFARIRDPIELTVIDDGTLDGDDRARLHEAVPVAKFLSREELDDRTLPSLGNHPRCRQFRREQAFALKLIDTGILSGGAFALCDSDILFLRDFDGFDRRGEDVGLVAMRDWTSAYAVSYKERWGGLREPRLIDNLNAGILYCGPRTFDLDFVEWFLAREDYPPSRMFLLEQTAWSALGARVRAFHFDPNQVAFPKKSRRFPADIVALHFIRVLRDLLDDPDYVAEAVRTAQPTATRLQLRRALVDGPVHGAITRLRRVVRPDYPPWHEKADR
jgi:hypothetical protein